MSERKYYIDNIRWATVLVVIVYHVIYIFNSVGVITNIDVQGIPQMDVFLSFVYPWFMNLLFVVGGMSAKYSLLRRDDKTFVKERVKRLFLPSVAGMFILGWVSGWVTNQYTDMFAGTGETVPGFFKYLIYCLCGIGPLWFARELFFASLVLVFLRAAGRKIGKRNAAEEQGGGKTAETKEKWSDKKIFAALLLLVFPVWGSAQILNTPLIEVYRNGIYFFMFLLGYSLFSREIVTDTLKKYSLPLLAAASVTGVAYSAFYYGQNYASQECLRGFFTNFYAWLGVLAMIGSFKRWFNGCNSFTKYMTERNFGYYALHYPLLSVIAWFVTSRLHLPMPGVYLLVLTLEFLLLPPFVEIVRRIPVLRFLLLGG